MPKLPYVHLTKKEKALLAVASLLDPEDTKTDVYKSELEDKYDEEGLELAREIKERIENNIRGFY